MKDLQTSGKAARGGSNPRQRVEAGVGRRTEVLASGFQVEPGCPKAPPDVSGAARVMAKTLFGHPGKDKGQMKEWLKTES